VKKVFITAANGLIGRALVKLYRDEVDLYGSYYPHKPARGLERCNYFALDVRDRDTVWNKLDEIKPDVVIHAASIGSVDYCEKNREEAYEVNVKGTEHILCWCNKVKVRMVFISSNAVFDGDNPPYSEDSPLNPINYYGELKAVSEKEVLECGGSHIIVRPILAYGWNDPNERLNPVSWLIGDLKAGKNIKLVDDRFSNPLFSESCAEAIWRSLEREEPAIYNIAGKDIVSRYEFGLKTAKVFGLDPDLIEPVPNSFFKEIAPRPVNTSYATAKMEKELGIESLGLEEGLRRMRDNKF